jgi:dTDP-L-rhamnose 4-epimerase
MTSEYRRIGSASAWRKRDMTKSVLITGGAGFIGSHVADEFLRHGYRVRVLDNLSLLAEGCGQKRPARPVHLDRDVELLIGDIRDPQTVGRALKGVDAVCHLASAVGAHQSMYQLPTYASINALGTAVLLDALVHHPVERLVVASSQSVYGEGLYTSSDGSSIHDAERSPRQLHAGEWDVRGDNGEALTAVPTPETKTLSLDTIYALSKFNQERMCLMMGRCYGLPTVVLRIFNAYGPRQIVLNPYLGVISVFASRMINRNAPVIYEDGQQLRDFVSVHDVAHAFLLALEKEAAPDHIFNIGSGEPTSISTVAMRLASALGKHDVKLRFAGSHRPHDVRHCFADISLAARLLGYYPRVSLDRGLSEIASWLESQVPYDRVEVVDD